MKMPAVLLVCLVAGCGGAAAESPSTDETTRPVRIEGEAPAPTGPGPVRVASPEEQASAPPAVTSDELADPPPIEPP
jgi:hypothetical protein